MATYYDEGFNPDDVSVKVSELLVATADQSDAMIDSGVQEVLALLRERLKMDVAFVSEFVDGQRVFRHVDTPAGNAVIAAGGADPLEASWCQRVIDGRLPELVPNVADLPATTRATLPMPPFDIGTHLSTPILLKNGEVYGTLCCFSFSPHKNIQQRDLRNLKSVAMLVAQKVGRTRDAANDAQVSFILQPKS